MLRISRTIRGVNLIELIIILVITVILITASAPIFTTLIQNYRLTATAESFYNSLQYARSEAIKQNKTIYVTFQTGDSWCYGINSSSSCNCSTPSSCNLGTNSAPTAQQISLSTRGLTSNTIQFENTHGAANASGTVTLTLYGQTTLITLSIGRLGNLQMCSTGISGYTGC